MIFCDCFVAQNQTRFQRAFYWNDERGEQYIPLMCDCFIGKKSRKLFENVYRSCQRSAKNGPCSATPCDLCHLLLHEKTMKRMTKKMMTRTIQWPMLIFWWKQHD
jgi:hypothetical protein